ncbi:MAG: choice-of-anchor D domain-containing protein, partial [Candidatus Moranbacteria bacterium]|nr:choice-of-anchor D domain-containing protein [Candidatus Moranbacteria bacterium]
MKQKLKSKLNIGLFKKNNFYSTLILASFLLISAFYIFKIINAASIVNDAYTFKDSFQDSTGVDLDQTNGFVNIGGAMMATAQEANLHSHCFSLPQPLSGNFLGWSFAQIELENTLDLASNQFQILNCSDNQTVFSQNLSQGINELDISSIPATVSQVKFVFNAVHTGDPNGSATAVKLNFWEAYGKSEGITNLTVNPDQNPVNHSTTVSFSFEFTSNGAETVDPLLNISMEDINGNGIDYGLAEDATVCYDLNNNGIVEHTDEECDFYKPILFREAFEGPNGETASTPSFNSSSGNITYELDNLPDGYSGAVSVLFFVPGRYIHQKTFAVRATMEFGATSASGTLNNRQKIEHTSANVTVNYSESKNFYNYNNSTSLYPYTGELLPGTTGVLHNYRFWGAETEGGVIISYHAGAGDCIPTFDSNYIYTRSGYPYRIIQQPADGSLLDETNPFVVKFYRGYDNRIGAYFTVPATCSEGQQITTQGEVLHEASGWTSSRSTTTNIIENFEDVVCRNRLTWHTYPIMSGNEIANDYRPWVYYNNNGSISPGQYYLHRLYSHGRWAKQTIDLEHLYIILETPDHLTFHGVRYAANISSLYKDSTNTALAPNDPSFDYSNPVSSGWKEVDINWSGLFEDEADDNNPRGIIKPGTRLLIIKDNDQYNTLISSPQLISRVCDGSWDCQAPAEGTRLRLDNTTSSHVYSYQTQVAPNLTDCGEINNYHSVFVEEKSYPLINIYEDLDKVKAGEEAQLRIYPRNHAMVNRYPESVWGVNFYNLKDKIDLSGITGKVVLPSSGEVPHPDQNIQGQSCNLEDIVFHPIEASACQNATNPDDPACFAYWEVPAACQMPNGWGTLGSYKNTYFFRLSAPVSNTVPAGEELTFQAEVRQTSDLSTLGADNTISRANSKYFTSTASVIVLSSPALNVSQTGPSIWPQNRSFTYNVDTENRGNGPNNGIYSVTLLPKQGDNLGSQFTPDYKKVYLNLSNDDAILEYSDAADCFENPESEPWNVLSLESTPRTGFNSQTQDDLPLNAVCLRSRIDPNSDYLLLPGDKILTAIDIFIPQNRSEGEEIFSKSLSGGNTNWNGLSLSTVETETVQTQVGYSIILDMEKEFFPDPQTGGKIKWTLKYSNQSADSASNIILQDTLPDTLIFEEIVLPLESNQICQNSCQIQNPNPDGSGGIISFIINNLEGDDGNPNDGQDQGEISFWTFIKENTSSGSLIENCGTISPDGAGIGDTACASLTTSNLNLEKTQILSPDFGSNQVQIEQNFIEYTISATNNETFPVYLRIYDEFSANVSFVQDSIKINGATASNDLIQNKIFDYTFSKATDPGVKEEISFTVKVNPELARNLSINNIASVSYCQDLNEDQTCVAAVDTNQVSATTIANELSSDKENLNFPKTTINQEKRLELIISNTDLAPLTLFDFIIEDDEAFQVEAEGDCEKNLVLNQGEQCNLIVSFSPPDYSSYETDLTIESDDTYEKQKIINLNGSAFIPGLEVTPQPLVFETIYPGETDNQVLTVKNTGDEILELKDFELQDPDSVFTQTENNCKKDLSPNQSCTLIFTFGPSEVKTFNQSYLTIFSNHPEAPEYRVDFSAQAIEEKEKKDCDELDVHDISIHETGKDYAVIKYKTTNKAKSQVNYSKNKKDLDKEEENKDEEKQHKVKLKNLIKNTTYYFEAEAEDECSKNKSKIYQFTTLGDDFIDPETSPDNSQTITVKEDEQNISTDSEQKEENKEQGHEQKDLRDKAKDNQSFLKEELNQAVFKLKTCQEKMGFKKFLLI